MPLYEGGSVILQNIKHSNKITASNCFNIKAKILRESPQSGLKRQTRFKVITLSTGKEGCFSSFLSTLKVLSV